MNFEPLIEKLKKDKEEAKFKQYFKESIAHMITSGKLPQNIFDFYFEDTPVGHMSFYDILDLMDY